MEYLRIGDAILVVGVTKAGNTLNVQIQVTVQGETPDGCLTFILKCGYETNIIHWAWMHHKSDHSASRKVSDLRLRA